MRKSAVRERIEQAIIEEINVTNLIAQNEPEIFIPKFIQTLTDRLNEIFQDEFKYHR